MSEMLETTVDKFTFKVDTGCYYTSEGVWAKYEDGLVRIGVSDFLQQRSGDVAFAEVKPVDTMVERDEEVAMIETIKVNIGLGAPVTGKVVEVNPAMEEAPEVINQDPYGAGWLAVLEPQDWEAGRPHLLDPQTYFAQMKAEAEQEAKNL